MARLSAKKRPAKKAHLLAGSVVKIRLKTMDKLYVIYFFCIEPRCPQPQCTKQVQHLLHCGL